ncbi:TRAFs-binding domain-containing protein [Sphingomonas azotifigens]|uniref:TRAFs-binding domain-containing protein n=1 Tax=Sphingomonas azotifigens TaxID=330920 RepID=UPI000A023E86|nr:TRAFs-binding domain-containing protein [Sphingomonas azotifigens]
MTSSVLAITAQARAGALDRAWQMFRDAGLDRVSDDPAVLSLKGRLLKDEALLLRGEARRAHAREAAGAYAAAAQLAPAPYPLINAATLALIAGDVAGSRALAADVQDLLQAGVPDETPYWLGATEAEARLLAGDRESAEAALAGAIALAPRAWEDHASTLRQFAVILAEQGAAAGWLDAYRPPRSLHFAGHMRLPEDVAALTDAIDTLLAEERIGFGYGALAAGADLLIAERLIARGAELHVVLPGDVAAFVDRSVRPHGERWVARFEAALAEAASVQELGEASPAAFMPSIRLADLIAMGRATMHAGLLQSEAVQLLVGPATVDEVGQSAHAGGLWRRAGRRQHLLPLRAPAASPGAEPSAPQIVAVLALDLLGDAVAECTALQHDVAARLPAVQQALAAVPPIAARWSARRLLLGFAATGDAYRAAGRISATLGSTGPLRQALHIGLATAIDDSVTGAPVLLGGAFDLAERILSVTAAGATFASEAFAASLAACEAEAGRAELVGEIELLGQAPTVLYALKPPVTR